MVYAREKHKAREITNQKIFLHPVSNTFHGRDIFAPAAAFLAAGGRPSQLGKLIEDHLKPTFVDPMRTSKRAWTGIVLKVDRFGNLITNFAIQEFEFLRERPFEIQVGAQRITQLAKTYGVAPPGEPVAIVGSSGYVEIAINQDSAARRLGCAAGAPVDLTIY
jgi:S-adenosylmethionine hydrolase